MEIFKEFKCAYFGKKIESVVPVKSMHFAFLDMGVAKKGCGTQNGNCITSQKSLLLCYLVILGVRSFLARLATTYWLGTLLQND